MADELGIVQLHALRLGYSPSKVVLDHVDLSIRRGDVVAILGSSGEGKTTLLQAMLGLIAPLSGEVRLLHRSLASLNKEERSQLFARIGVVFQHNALFTDMSVAENLAMVAYQTSQLRKEVVRELVSLRLRSVGLPGFESRRPDQLSGGQRKRVAFARAIMLDPEILFCDEPTAGLDPLTAGKLSLLIQHLGSELGATMVMITHDVDLIHAIATRVVIVGGGEIHVDAPLDALRESSDPLVRGLLGQLIAPRAVS